MLQQIYDLVLNSQVLSGGFRFLAAWFHHCNLFLHRSQLDLHFPTVVGHKQAFPQVPFLFIKVTFAGSWSCPRFSKMFCLPSERLLRLWSSRPLPSRCYRPRLAYMAHLAIMCVLWVTWVTAPLHLSTLPDALLVLVDLHWTSTLCHSLQLYVFDLSHSNQNPTNTGIPWKVVLWHKAISPAWFFFPLSGKMTSEEMSLFLVVFQLLPTPSVNIGK